jgi:hypothetical protein
MARVKAGYKNLTVTVTEEVADALDDAHWTLRREVGEILTEIVTNGVEEIKASTGK